MASLQHSSDYTKPFILKFRLPAFTKKFAIQDLNPVDDFWGSISHNYQVELKNEKDQYIEGLVTPISFRWNLTVACKATIKSLDIEDVKIHCYLSSISRQENRPLIPGLSRNHLNFPVSWTATFELDFNQILDTCGYNCWLITDVFDVQFIDPDNLSLNGDRHH